MKMPSLPELPTNPSFPWIVNLTPEQARAYALQYGQIVREECAKLCKGEAEVNEQASQRAVTATGAVQFEAMGAGARNCADAILRDE